MLEYKAFEFNTQKEYCWDDFTLNLIILLRKLETIERRVSETL